MRISQTFSRRQQDKTKTRQTKKSIVQSWSRKNTTENKRIYCFKSTFFLGQPVLRTRDCFDLKLNLVGTIVNNILYTTFSGGKAPSYRIIAIQGDPEKIFLETIDFLCSRQYFFCNTLYQNLGTSVWDGEINTRTGEQNLITSPLDNRLFTLLRRGEMWYLTRI